MDMTREELRATVADEFDAVGLEFVDKFASDKLTDCLLGDAAVSGRSPLECVDSLLTNVAECVARSHVIPFRGVSVPDAAARLGFAIAAVPKKKGGK